MPISIPGDYLLETVTNVFTSQAEIERRISQTGADLRMADLDNYAIDEMWEEIIVEATDIIAIYCQEHYEHLALSESMWVRARASWIGAYLLSQRKGNPAIFEESYSRIIDELEKVRSRLVYIPRIGVRAELTPTLSNLIIDDNFTQNKIRIQTVTGEGAVDSRQRQDRWYHIYHWF